MLMSYWDGGYVQLDVTNPNVADPVILADTDFALRDPANTSGLTPEGNAHQAEFTRDDRFFFATDEDFDPYRGPRHDHGRDAQRRRVHRRPGW
jgi:hypothetical protein